MPRPGFYNDNEYRAYPFITTDDSREPPADWTGLGPCLEPLVEPTYALPPETTPPTTGPELVINGSFIPAAVVPWPTQWPLYSPTPFNNYKTDETKLFDGWSASGRDVQVYSWSPSSAPPVPSAPLPADVKYFAHIGANVEWGTCGSWNLFTAGETDCTAGCVLGLETGPVFIDNTWFRATYNRSGVLWQFLETVPGKSYLVKFNAAGNWLPNDASPRTCRVDAAGKQLLVEISPTTQPSGGWTFTPGFYRAPNFTFEEMGWTPQEFVFTANSTRTVLRFTGTSFQSSNQGFIITCRAVCVTDVSVKELAQ